MEKRVQIMIDKFFYWLFSNVDAYAQWIEKQFNKPKKKKKKLKKVITEEQWIKKMVGKNK